MNTRFQTGAAAPSPPDALAWVRPSGRTTGGSQRARARQTTPSHSSLRCSNCQVLKNAKIATGFGGKDDFVEAKALAGTFRRKWQGARTLRNPDNFGARTALIQSAVTALWSARASSHYFLLLDVCVYLGRSTTVATQRTSKILSGDQFSDAFSGIDRCDGASVIHTGLDHANFTQLLATITSNSCWICTSERMNEPTAKGQSAKGQAERSLPSPHFALCLA